MVCRSRCCYGFHLLCPLLKCEDTLSKSSYKALILSTNFTDSFQGETTIGLAQPVCTPKWHQFPVCKSAHPWTGHLPCTLSSHCLSTPAPLFAQSTYFRKTRVITVHSLCGELYEWHLRNGVMSIAPCECWGFAAVPIQ